MSPIIKLRAAILLSVAVCSVAALCYWGFADQPKAPPPVTNIEAVRAEPAPDADKLDRTVLPIPEPPVAPITEVDARKAKAPPRFEVKAPKGAPNVVIVLIDDMGFGQSSAFGGPVQMKTVEKLA